MGRVILVLILMAISGIIYLAKAGARKVTGGREVNFRDESQKVMEKTAKGVHWMNDQWEQAKSQAKSGNQLRSDKSSRFDQKPAEIVISTIRSNPSEYNNAEAEAIYVEQALRRIKEHEYEDARLIAYQVLDKHSRDYILGQIEASS